MSVSGILQLSDLTLAAQQRSDMVNSQFLSQSEWTANINSSAEELYDILVESFGEDYAVQTPYLITTDGINNQFSLPTDFYKLLGVDLNSGTLNNPYITLKPFNFSERNRYMIPSAGLITRLWYVPRLAPLVNQTDTLDGVGGWAEYVVIDAAIKALVKEESDTSALERAKDKMLARITSAAENRDAGQAYRVVDVYEQNIYPMGGPTLRYRLVGNTLWLGQYQVQFPFGTGSYA